MKKCVSLRIYKQRMKNGEKYTVLDAYNDFKFPLSMLIVENEAGKILCFSFYPFIHKRLCNIEVKRVYHRWHRVTHFVV